MTKAKIFANGRSQAVRLPKEFRFDSDEVIIRRMGSAVVLLPPNGWDVLFDALDECSEDFMENGREQPVEQQLRDLHL